MAGPQLGFKTCTYLYYIEFIGYSFCMILPCRTRLKLRTASAEHPQQKANSNCCARASKPSPFLRGQCLDLRITHMVWCISSYVVHIWFICHHMSYDLTSVTSQVEAGWSTPRRASSKRRCELSTAWAAWPQELRTTSKIKEISRIKRLFKSIFKIIVSSFHIFFYFFNAHDLHIHVQIVRERCLRPHDAPHAPLVVCLHGLNGSVSSFSRFSRLGAISHKTSLFLRTFSTVYLAHGLQYSLLSTCVCLVCFRSLFMSKRSSVYLPIQAKKLNQKRFCVSLSYEGQRWCKLASGSLRLICQSLD